MVREMPSTTAGAIVNDDLLEFYRKNGHLPEGHEDLQLPAGPENPFPEEPAEDRSQIDFAVRMIKRYLSEKNRPFTGIRRLHYFIVTLPQEERMLPSKGDVKTLYGNTLYWFGQSSKHLVDARLRGIIPWDWVIDEKNEDLIPIPDRKPAETFWNITAPEIRPLPSFEVDNLPEWNDWLNDINIDYNVSRPVFNNQKYRVVVAIEKATSRSELESLCSRYGADLLIFGGQFSVTRIHDVVLRAKMEVKPIMLLYISDLDVSGWDMAPAFMGRLQQMYPREDHKMVRVALTRQQVEEYNLPESFDPHSKGKGTEASKTRIKNFIKETKGESCVELDALDEDILLSLLATQLKKYSEMHADRVEYDQAIREAGNTKRKIKSEYVGHGEILEEFESVRTEFNQIVEELKILKERYGNRLDDLNNRKTDIEETIVAGIRGAYGLREFEWGAP